MRERSAFKGGYDTKIREVERKPGEKNVLEAIDEGVNCQKIK